jgi:regulatory protein YycI of two-component signal transduction system YycFG
VEEFLKTYLKNKCSYSRKRGYLTEKTNQKQDQHVEEEEQEDLEQEDLEQEDLEQEEGRGYKGKGKERQIEEDDGDSEVSNPDDFYGSPV